MGFSFRRSVRLFPGVSLNVSARGFSTTVGTRGATLTTGSRGSRLHLGLPGTGLSFDHNFSSGRSSRAPRLPVPTEASWPAPPAPSPDLSSLLETVAFVAPGEIRSQGNDTITSLTLVELRNLLAEAYTESRRLRAELLSADAELR